MNIRAAKQSDKEIVLRFCTDTFEWGDYIDQVWDRWCGDRNGVLMAAEEELHNKQTKKRRPSVIAISHVSLCHNKKAIWLEGIRVKPNYRRKYVATELINKMIAYGKEKGANQASAIVAYNNVTSQSMMQKNGFVMISEWSYYSTDKIPQKDDKLISRSKVAAVKDTEAVQNYLKQSRIFRSSGERYVNSWRWYSLDLYSNTLVHLIENKKVLIAGNDCIEGVAIINQDRDGNVFQIVYLDASNLFLTGDLLRFALNLIHSEAEIYHRIQVFSPGTTYLSALMEQLGMDRSERFLLYRREI